MGEKIKNNKLLAMFPSVLMTLWAGNVFVTSLDKEPWRIICSGIAFVGLTAMSYFFIRKIKQQSKVSE